MMQPLLGARYQGVRPEGVRATRARAAGCGRLAGVVPRNRRSGPGGRQVFGIGLYQRPYPVTAFAHGRLVSEAMRSVICISLFQASQHASRMAS